MAQSRTIAVETTEMHTGGEPVCIVESGYPKIPRRSILQKREYVRKNLDHLRTQLMFEPRGHYDMYGVIQVEPDHPDADMAVLFMHNSGYSTMCGHAIIALGRYAVDNGLVEVHEPESRVVIQCPCGPVVAHVDVSDGRTGDVHFDSVGAFAFEIDAKANLQDWGSITYDIGYGGAFYAIADATQFGLDIRTSSASELVAAATTLTKQVQEDVPLDHPDAPELGFLYGTILTDGVDDGSRSTNVCVFADAQVDRSPTGSGVTARMALRHAKELTGIDEMAEFESVTGSTMTGRVLAATQVGQYAAVVIQVGGRSFYTGSATFTVEKEDPLGDGFLVR